MTSALPTELQPQVGEPPDGPAGNPALLAFDARPYLISTSGKFKGSVARRGPEELGLISVT
jgi:hypothetical protein